MMSNLSRKTKHFFFILIKISIVVAAFVFIYYKLTHNKYLTFTEFINLISQSHIITLKNSAILLGLSFLNWVFESLKWKSLIEPVSKITLSDSIEQSLGALTASLFTPNRIGEYGAKAIYYSTHLRKRVLLITLISNVLQMFATLCLGIIGLLFYLSKYHAGVFNTNLLIFTLIALLFLVIGIITVYKVNFKIKGFSLFKLKHFMSNYPKHKFVYGLIYSFARYALFSFQFYVLLTLFQINISYFNAMVVISSMYLLASLIPSVVMFDFVVKGGIAVYLFSFLGINNLSILSITISMWLLNFVLPSILGSYYVLSFKLSKKAELQ